MPNFAATQLGGKFEKFTESLLSSISIYAVSEVQNIGNFQQVLLLPGKYHNPSVFLLVSVEMEGY